MARRFSGKGARNGSNVPRQAAGGRRPAADKAEKLGMPLAPRTQAEVFAVASRESPVASRLPPAACRLSSSRNCYAELKHGGPLHSRT